jgi:hypothetical protein
MQTKKSKKVGCNNFFYLLKDIKSKYLAKLKKYPAHWVKSFFSQSAPPAPLQHFETETEEHF